MRQSGCVTRFRDLVRNTARLVTLYDLSNCGCLLDIRCRM
ncbi:conserved hypothetical protein [Stutzerimonas stutzeri DSM 4166]|nr:conserved hypothetical protein [Stutzerimonas stutzeri DSM 4166]